MNLLEQLKKIRKELEEKSKVIKDSNASEFGDLSYGALIDIIERLSNENYELKKQIDYTPKPTLLENKVNDFIKWYREENIEDLKSQRTVNWLTKRLQEFMDKVVVWYELKYPDVEIENIFWGKSKDNKKIDDIMFKDNPYIQVLFDKKSDVRLLEWNALNNLSVFIESLSGIEKQFLAEPQYYKEIVYYDNDKAPHFHIDKDGTVLEAEYMRFFNKEDEGITNKDVVGLNIEEVIALFNEKGINISPESEMLKEVRKYNNHYYFRNELLNCIMYKMIERGDNRYGAKRALLFAEDFGLDIDIPMIYGVDTFDDGLKSFVKKYLDAGGSKDLVCLKNYFYGNRIDEDSYETITVEELSNMIKDKKEKEKVKKNKI